MIHQLNVAHKRAHTITHDRTFNGKPLYYFEDGLILEYLEEMESVLTKVLENTPRLTVAHLDLRFLSDFGGNHSEVFRRFFRSLAAESNQLCLKKNKHRSHQYHHTIIHTQKALLMANRTYLPSITLDRIFEDYPLYYSDKGLYESALTSMVDVFELALSQFETVLATRLDLYLPKDHQDTDLSTLKDYFEILKEKLNTNSLHYVWRKRADSRSHHYQVMLFTDYKQNFGAAISMDKRNEIVGHLKTAWGEAIKKHYEGNERSMVQLNDRENYSLGTRCKSKDTDIKNCVYKRMSSLAEAWSETRYFFGSSLE